MKCAIVIVQFRHLEVISMKIIHTTDAPAAVGPYSQAVVSGGMVYTAGQVALDPASGAMVGTDVTAQAHQVMKNLTAVLSAAGSGLDKAVRPPASWRTWTTSPPQRRVRRVLPEQARPQLRGREDPPQGRPLRGGSNSRSVSRKPRKRGAFSLTHVICCYIMVLPRKRREALHIRQAVFAYSLRRGVKV